MDILFRRCRPHPGIEKAGMIDSPLVNVSRTCSVFPEIKGISSMPLKQSLLAYPSDIAPQIRTETFICFSISTSRIDPAGCSGVNRFFSMPLLSMSTSSRVVAASKTGEIRSSQTVSAIFILASPVKEICRKHA